MILYACMYVCTTKILLTHNRNKQTPSCPCLYVLKMCLTLSAPSFRSAFRSSKLPISRPIVRILQCRHLIGCILQQHLLGVYTIENLYLCHIHSMKSSLNLYSLVRVMISALLPIRKDGMNHHAFNHPYSHAISDSASQRSLHVGTYYLYVCTRTPFARAH